MAGIKMIAGFDETKQRNVMTYLSECNSKAATAKFFETSRGTIIRIEAQMGPLLDEEIEAEIMQAEAEANDDSLIEEEVLHEYYLGTKIRKTSFIVLMFEE